MTLKIEIEVPADMIVKDFGPEYIGKALGVLGYTRVGAVAQEHTVNEAVRGATGGVNMIRPENFPADVPGAVPDKPLETSTSADTTAPEAELDTRPVGSPSAGNKRRNSAEKAEDDEFEKLAGSKGVPLDKLNNVIGEAGRSVARAELEKLDRAADAEAAEAKAAISSGENRIGPEDDAETEAADAADEAAETAKAGLAPIDELRRAVGAYQKKLGMPAAVALCAEGGLIGCGITEVPEADIPAVLAKLQAAMGDAPAEAPAKAEPEKPAEKAATAEDVKSALMRYAAKFDAGNSDMPATMEDGPKILNAVFGPGITKISHIPTGRFDEAVAGIEEAIAKNPYKRGAK